MERFKLNFRENPVAKNALANKTIGVKAVSSSALKTSSSHRISSINKDVLVKKINAVADIINQNNTVIISKEKQEQINSIIEE